jgi:hypothetical protein
MTPFLYFKSIISREPGIAFLKILKNGNAVQKVEDYSGRDEEG